MTTQKKFRGDTIAHRFKFKNSDLVLVDPDTLTIKIINPNGVLIDSIDKTGSEFSRQGAGIYNFLWNIPNDSVYGLWTLEVASTIIENSETLQNTERFTFHVQK